MAAKVIVEYYVQEHHDSETITFLTSDGDTGNIPRIGEMVVFGRGYRRYSHAIVFRVEHNAEFDAVIGHAWTVAVHMIGSCSDG